MTKPRENVFKEVLEEKQLLRTQKPSRKRVQLTCPEKSITDPDAFRELSMESIKRKLDNQQFIGNLTNNVFYSEEPMKYTNLQDALTFHQRVSDQFNALPLEIRKAMGHNIQNFEKYINDSKNHDTLKKYGLVKSDQNDPVLNEMKELRKDLSDSRKEHISKEQK